MELKQKTTVALSTDDVISGLKQPVAAEIDILPSSTSNWFKI
jgi:hypothetical protein